MDTEQKYIWINGRPIPVSAEVYEAYTKGTRKMRYFEVDLKIGRIVRDKDGRMLRIIPSREDSLERLTENGTIQFTAEVPALEDSIINALAIEALHAALALLDTEERELIVALYFLDQTEAAVGARLGISQQAVSKRKQKILKKLRLFLEN